jgi:transcriptional regulator of aroF, aroG, tyrA and aromatic amino acid transport
MPTIRWRVDSKDRVGMVLDILRVLSDYQINILAMEVESQVVYLKFVSASRDRNSLLRKELLANPDINTVAAVESLPQERRERQLQTIMETVNEGILAAEPNGRITHINSSAARLLNLSREEAVGKSTVEILGRKHPLSSALTFGKNFINEEVEGETPTGVCHYLTTGNLIRNDKGEPVGVVSTLQSITEVRKLVNVLAKSSMITFADIVYRSQSMARAIDIAGKIAQTDSTVLIWGESGTGKELFARSIHSASSRRNRNYVPINCAALPETLLESELFGYEEGAFSGAKKGGKPGLFAVAHLGTLFLDEIGEMPLPLQSKLLRVIQDGRIRRLGSQEELPVDVRIIAATNRNLEEMVAQNKFRRDLFYRLNVIPIYIPPLRERVEDITPLLEHLLEKFRHRFGKNLRLSIAAKARLLQHHWPGNIRELENVVERAVILVEGEEIRPEHLLLDQGPQATGPGKTEASNLKYALAEVEKQLLAEALAQHQTIRAASKALGISHTALRKKAARLGLSFPHRS